MSFWDRIKPQEKRPMATGVELAENGSVLRLTWDDGKASAVRARTLRQRCPCASCVDEWTHQRTLDAEAVPQDTRILDMRAVGNYALGFSFSDGHQTGIFNWTLLREASEQEPAAS